MRAFLTIVMAACVTPAAAQTTPSVAAEKDDVVVNGQVDPADPDPANLRAKVFVGSRLKRQSLQNNPNIAMMTSANGLDPTSGVDAWRNDATLRWKSCKLDGAYISKRVACALAAAQKMLTAGEAVAAHARMVMLAGDPDLTAEERYWNQRYLYRTAAAIPDAAEKRKALTAMVATGMMPTGEELSAIRTLASMAMKADDRAEALRRYEQASELDRTDTQSRINAASLLQSIGDNEKAAAHIRTAITIAQTQGRPVPQTWLDNARQ